jgi:thiamine biosynthesis lipoprotein
LPSLRVGLALVLVLLLAACTREPDILKRQAYVFGTLVEVSVVDAAPRAEAAITQILRRFDALHRQLHAWQPSELTRLNAALARGEKFTATPTLAAMLRDAQALAAASGGRFNPAIGQLIALWGFQSDTPPSRLPPASEIARRVAEKPSMADLRFDGNTVWSVNPAVRLDLGGYAKGYALDAAVAILQQHGVANALVNIGGNVIARGTAGGRPWRVGVQHPRAPGVLASLALHDGEALGTSGDYQRFFEVDGVRYCHVIDPATGYPARAWQSVTVLTRGARAGVRSDALSKPLFVASGAKPSAASLASDASRLHLTEYVAVDARGQTFVAPALAPRLR